MDISTLINIILCILSFILAVISVITVVITLRQNHKMISNSTRPYVVIYSATTNFESPHYYICIKNFGQSGALITDLSCDYDLKNLSYNEKRTPFENISNTFIAPGQSFVCCVDHFKLFEHNEPITFCIKYKNDNTKYSESFSIKIEVDSDLVHLRSNTKDKEIRTMSYTLQEMVERML